MTLSCYGRNSYVQDRVEAALRARGEAMILRAVSELVGIEPYRNPPDLSADLFLVAASSGESGNFIGIAGTTVTGRLVPGDQLLIADGAIPPTVLTVLAMPPYVMTDGDGIPITDGGGNPVFGEPVVTYTDTLSRDNRFPVVAIDSDASGLVGFGVSVTFAADRTVYGVQMSRQKMVALGWIELDSIGVEIAGKGIPNPQPKVNDQILFAHGTDLRSIISVGVQARGDVNFLFQIQAR